MNDFPLVTVIIPTYNSSHTIKYAISSVLNQTFQDFEIRVIGDGCRDDTEMIVQSFQDERIHWYNLAQNSGSQPAPNNEGLRQAQGSLIAYQGHDDLWLPDHLSSLVKHIQSTESDWVYAMSALLKPDDDLVIRGHQALGIPDNMHATPPSSWMHKKEVTEKIGMWEEDYWNLTVGPDADFFQRGMKALKFSCTRSLSLVKFDSVIWRSYQNQSSVGDIIESTYQQMSENPSAYQKKLLLDATYRYSQYYEGVYLLKPRQLFRLFFRYYFVRLRSLHDRNQLVRFLFKKIYRHRRRKTLSRRGL